MLSQSFDKIMATFNMMEWLLFWDPNNMIVLDYAIDVIYCIGDVYELIFLLV